jgi:PAS domain S-box-containing protein
MLGSLYPMFIAWGPKLAFLYNDAYRPIFGTKHPLTLGQPFESVWPEIWSDIQPLVKRALDGEATFNENLHLVMERNGFPEDTWYTFSYSPVRDESGGVGGMFCACQETTGQVLAERKLVAEQDRQRALFERAPGFIAILKGPEHIFEFANAAYARATGRQAFVGRPVREVFGDLEGQGIFELLDQVYATGERFIAEHIALKLQPCQTAPAQDVYLDFIYEPIRDDGGTVTGIFIEGHDVTESHLARERLRESTAYLETVLDAVPAAIWIARDADASRIDGNAFARQLLKVPGDANQSMTATDPDERPRGFRILDRNGVEIPGDDLPVQRAARGEIILDHEEQLVFDDGESVYLTGNARPLLDQSGKAIGAVATFVDITRSRESAAALRESEERFRNMADHAPVMMWVTDPNGYCTYLNRSWYEFTGQDPKDAEGFGWLDAVHPEDRARAETDFREANASRTAFRAEYRLRRADGVYRWAIDAASPRFGDAGQWLGYVGSVIDIDARREAEDRLRQSEARFRAAVDAVQGVLWTNNAVGEMKGPQPAWAALTGQSPEEYRDHGWVKAVHPDDASPSVEAWKDAVAERKTFVFEHRVRRHVDGEWRRFSIRAIPLFEPNGEVGEWVGVHTDVTELREIEAALRDGEARFRAMAEAMPGFVWTADAQGCLDYTSPHWAEYSGDGGGESFGSGWADFVHDADKPRAFAAWQASLTTLQPYEVEFRLRSRDGLYRWWLVRAMPIVDADRAVRWIGSATDIDEIVEARIQLARSQVELEQRVAERSAELMQTQDALRQSQKLEAMGQLTGGVAHDFNNLLTPIVGALDLLQRRGVGGEREQRLIDGAMQSSERARILVQRLLAFARRQPLQSQAVDVDALVKGMADLIASTSGPGIKVVVDIDPDLPAAQADPNQIEMAVLNLSVNARDAMPNGGQLTISAADEVVAGPHRAGLLPGGYVRISVADTGTGMDEATLARAIEPFYSTKGVGKGTGLGLSMVHGLASQLGGALLISSKVGLGTRIEFWLPATVHGPATVDRPEPATVGEGSAKGRVLLVDDEDLVRLSTADMLSEIGFMVIETASAEEALAVLRDGPNISAVITDHLMPGMTGVDLARVVKETWPNTPVLIVSGYAEGEGLAPDLPRLSKPFRKADLTSSLASLMGSRS